MTSTFAHGNGRFVATPSGPVYVEVEGEGPPVLLVSGGPGVSHVHYHPWFSRLADHHTVVYYDHPGVGRSSREAGKDAYTLPAYAEAIESIRDHLDAATIALVGLSFGGLPAIEYTRRHPDRVRRLVMTNAPYSARTWQRGNIDNVNHEISTRYPELWDRLVALRERGVRSLADEYQEIVGAVLPELEWADRLAHPDLTRPAEDVDRYNPDAYEAFLGADPEWTVAGSLAGYDPMPMPGGFPVLIIAGRHDRVTPVVVAHSLQRDLGGRRPSEERARRSPPTDLGGRRPSEERARRSPPTDLGGRLLVFEHSAHRPWAEEPDRYFAELIDFLG